MLFARFNQAEQDRITLNYAAGQNYIPYPLLYIVISL